MISKLILLIFTYLLVLSAPVFLDEHYPQYIDDSMSAQNVMALINTARVHRRLSPLSENNNLDQSACMKLNDMVKYNYWNHVSPAGVKPWHWFIISDYDYRYAGENLAYGQTTAKELVGQWMTSPKHKANILNRHYTEQGICIKYVYFMGGETWLTVSHLGSKN